MNDSRKAPKETADWKLEVLIAKTKTRISFWNLCTVYETWKLAPVTAEVRHYSQHTLGVSKSWWLGSGR